MEENTGVCTVGTSLLDGRAVEVTVSTTGEVVVNVYPSREASLDGKPNESIVTDVDGLVEAFSE